MAAISHYLVTFAHIVYTGKFTLSRNQRKLERVEIALPAISHKIALLGLHHHNTWPQTNNNLMVVLK